MGSCGGVGAGQLHVTVVLAAGGRAAPSLLRLRAALREPTSRKTGMAPGPSPSLDVEDVGAIEDRDVQRAGRDGAQLVEGIVAASWRRCAVSACSIERPHGGRQAEEARFLDLSSRPSSTRVQMMRWAVLLLTATRCAACSRRQSGRVPSELAKDARCRRDTRQSLARSWVTSAPPA